ncbi:lysophospholipid acyltransferase family protein [Thermodesulfobacteriota bacterium]
MTDVFIRILKGMCMFVMFALFFMGILVHLIFILPVSSTLDLLYGPKLRFERAVRVGFRWWLGIMGLLGLVKADPSEGRPMGGPCVVVCNHPGLFDVLFLITEIPNLSVMVKTTLSRKLPLGPILRALGYVLVPDFDRISPLETAEESIGRIKKGSKLQLFPEGTRSPYGGLRPFRSGAFKIARMTNVPVQPVLIRNQPPFLPKEDKWYFPQKEVSHVKMEFWEPLMPPEKRQEGKFASKLEERFRNALGIISHGDTAAQRKNE